MLLQELEDKLNSKVSSPTAMDLSIISVCLHDWSPIQYSTPKKPTHKSTKKDGIGKRIKLTDHKEENKLLNENDKKQVEGNEWLTDKHINAVNNLLSHRFPSQNGLMCPLIYTG